MVTMSTYSNLMFYREKERMVEERLKLLLVTQEMKYRG
jgi:hypothetical protein